jgi:hypothetical protein
MNAEPADLFANDAIVEMAVRYVAHSEALLNDLRADYRELTRTEPPAEFPQRRLVAVVTLMRASMSGASARELDTTFKSLVNPLDDVLNNRAAAVEDAAREFGEAMHKVGLDVQRRIDEVRARVAATRDPRRQNAPDSSPSAREKIEAVATAVAKTATLAASEFQGVAKARSLLKRVRSRLRSISRTRFVWRAAEVLGVVGAGFVVEQINEGIRDRVIDGAGVGVGAGAHQSFSAALATTAVWLVLTAAVIWFHDSVVNEQMAHRIDERRRDELLADMLEYFFEREILEYVLDILESQVSQRPSVELE